jgi:hypothetical protein
MSNSATTLPQNDVSPVADAQSRPATLITEQQVRFSTAVALSAPTRQQTRRKARRHNASRHSFLDASLMRREMHRL